MKFISKFRILALTVVTALYVTSCSKENTQDDSLSQNPTPEAVNNDLNQVTSTDDNLKLFNESLLLTGFKVDDQNGNREIKFGYTFFAPTDEAFKVFLKENGFTSLSQVPVKLLNQVLSNHVVKGKFLSTDLKTGYLSTLSKAEASNFKNTLSLYVNTSAGVKLNGVSTVVKADLNKGFVVVHKVDKVIPLPTIVTHAIANASFTSLVGALTSPGQPDFVTILSGKGPFTVFAPTNDAFKSLDAELAPGGIASVSAANLTKVLQYHVLSGNVLASSLKNKLEVTTLLTQKFTVTLPPPAITDANKRVSKIIATDVQCTNGVIHVLDKVLLPTL
jgi:uncharacterized surface protein with fasciclin (FAS1) repeats